MKYPKATTGEKGWFLDVYTSVCSNHVIRRPGYPTDFPETQQSPVLDRPVSGRILNLRSRLTHEGRVYNTTPTVKAILPLYFRSVPGQGVDSVPRSEEN